LGNRVGAARAEGGENSRQVGSLIELPMPLASLHRPLQEMAARLRSWNSRAAVKYFV